MQKLVTPSTEFMNHIKSKRYTWTRLQRMLTHIFTGITKEQLHQFESPTYIRLLGMTSKGQQYLAEKKKEFELPLISRVAQTKDQLLQIDHSSNRNLRTRDSIFFKQKNRRRLSNSAYSNIKSY